MTSKGNCLSIDEILNMITDEMAEDSDADPESEAEDSLPNTSSTSPFDTSLSRDITNVDESIKNAFDSQSTTRQELLSDQDQDEEMVESEGEENNVDRRNQTSTSCDFDELHWEKTSHVPQHFSNTSFCQRFGISSEAEVNIKSPKQIFMQIITLTFMQYIVEQSNLYATQKGSVLNLTVLELQAFFGMLIIMGFNRLPSMRLYWSTDMNFHHSRIASVMPIKRFLKILRYIHLNDNTKIPKRGEPNYRTHKFKPFIDIMNTNFRKLFDPSRYLSVDESMVKFKGRSTLKQYMPMKPIKRGFKMWVIACAVTGYCLGLFLYEGKENSDQTSTSLGERVVTRLAQGFEGLGYCLFFDNFFSNIQMMKTLLQKTFFACATIRQTRKLFPSAELTFDKNLKMGECDFVMAGDIGISKWKDRGKKCVCVISTMHDAGEKSRVLRTNKQGNRELVTCPVSIKDYNCYMGGVDHFDQLMLVYDVSWKSRRWWMKILYYCINACIVNSYILYGTTVKTIYPHHKPLSHLQFRSVLATELIGDFCARVKKGPLTQKGKGRKRNNPDGRSTIPNVKRLTNVGDHLPAPGTRRRCGFCSTGKEQKRSNIMCIACDVALCLQCFVPFHKS